MNDDLDMHDQQHQAPSPRAELARQHAAYFPATLALDRWRRVPTPGQISDDDGLIERRAWYAEQQQHHQCWLDQGGWSQLEPDGSACETGPPVEPLGSQPDANPASTCASSALAPPGSTRQCKTH